MTHYIGIDIIEIARIRKALERRGERFLHRIYTEPEIRLYGTKPPSLATRFACKEAVMKLLGAGSRGIRWREIETIPLPGGQPRLTLYGQARREANRLGLKSISVSLSHCREYAIASVIGATEHDK